MHIVFVTSYEHYALGRVRAPRDGLPAQTGAGKRAGARADLRLRAPPCPRARPGAHPDLRGVRGVRRREAACVQALEDQGASGALGRPARRPRDGARGVRGALGGRALHRVAAQLPVARGRSARYARGRRCGRRPREVMEQPGDRPRRPRLRQLPASRAIRRPSTPTAARTCPRTHGPSSRQGPSARGCSEARGGNDGGKEDGAAASGSPVLARAFGVAPGASEVGMLAGFSGAGSGRGSGSGTISASPGCACVSMAVTLNTRYGWFCDPAST